MAQFLTLLPVLLLFAVFNPIVCPNGPMYNERRDRSPYIESNEHSPQYLGDPQGGRSRKVPLHKDQNIMNYRSQELQEHNVGNHPNNYEETTTESNVEKNIRSVFSTNFGPGLYLFKNASQPATINRTFNKDKTVYFPTEEPEKDDSSYTVDTNDCVEKDVEKNGKPFCTNLRNYPEKTHLEQIIKQRFSNLESFFGEDLVIPQNISQRMNNEPNEEFLCKSRTRVIYPQAGLNKDYNWLIIVNIPNYKQGIRIEECINEGSPCGESNGLSLPNHYTATCKQSYIYRSLVAYTNDTVIKDQFKMPSCCKCVLRTG